MVRTATTSRGGESVASSKSETRMDPAAARRLWKAGSGSRPMSRSRDGPVAGRSGQGDRADSEIPSAHKNAGRRFARRQDRIEKMSGCRRAGEKLPEEAFQRAVAELPGARRPEPGWSAPSPSRSNSSSTPGDRAAAGRARRSCSRRTRRSPDACRAPEAPGARGAGWPGRSGSAGAHSRVPLPGKNPVLRL